jgi:Predicted permeases
MLFLNEPPVSRFADAVSFVLMASFWALNYPLVKFAYAYETPMALLFFRILFAAVSSLIIFNRGIHIPRDLLTNLKILVFALLNLVLFMGFWFAGEATESSALSSIIIYSYPVITIALSSAFLKEKLSGLRIAGTAVGFVGLLFIFIQQLIIRPGIGLIFLVLAAVSWSVATVYFRKYLVHVGSMTVNTLQFIYALPFIVAFVVPFQMISISGLTPKFLAIMVYMGALSTAVAYWIYMRLYTKYSVSEISALFFAVPAISIVFSYFLLGEKNTIFTYFGFALIAAGIFLSSRKMNSTVSKSDAVTSDNS